MPERIGRFSFYSDKELDEMGWVPPTAEELDAARATLDAFGRLGETLPPTQGSHLGDKWHVDDMVGTDLEGCTRDPVTDTWRDAYGRPAHDATDQRIHYPDSPTESA